MPLFYFISSKNEDFCLFKIFFSFFIWQHGGGDETVKNDVKRSKAVMNSRRRQQTVEGDDERPKMTTNNLVAMTNNQWRQRTS